MRAALVASAALVACTSPASHSPYSSSPPPLNLTVSADPPGFGPTRLIPTNASLRATFDDYPNPDTVAYGPVLLRSGAVSVDYAARVDLVGRSIVITPRLALQPGATYELIVTPEVMALDGRRLAATVATTILVGDGPAPLTPPAPPTWRNDVAPILASCAPSCHSRVDGSGVVRPPLRQLDLTGDPTDPIYGLIGVPSLGLRDSGALVLRVAAGDSARSVLLRKLLGGDGRASSDASTPSLAVDGQRMPPGLMPLPQSEVQLVEDWINAGALP